MERQIEFISDKSHFMKNLLEILKNPVHTEIIVSGFLNESMLPEIISNIIKNGYAGKCRILIPCISNKARLREAQAKEICSHGGSIRVNSSFRSKLIVIDEQVFIVSFLYKVNDDHNQKLQFDNCVFIKCKDVSQKIKSIFNEKWDKGFPIDIDNIQEEIR